MRQPTDDERRDIVRAVFDESVADHANGPRFEAYFKHYCSLVCPAASGDAVIEVETPALKDHTDVLACVQIIIQNPRLSLDEFVVKAFGSKAAGASDREKQHVARVACEVAFAIDCSLRDYYPDNFVDGGFRLAKWEKSVTFLCFVEKAFKSQSEKSQAVERHQRHEDWMNHKTSLKAWKLVKRYGIKIRGTDNLLEHLTLDLKTMTLKVFHQVSFLRAHLAKSRQEALDLGFEESLKRGTLPPRLLLETLLTFHEVLFPVASVRDKRSRAALENMIKRQGFDAEGRWIEFVWATPADMTFDYWGDRLSAIYDLVKRPPPNNAVVAWFERHTSERNALTVAILGLFLAALFGLLSFIVGLLQLILAWMAYKNPPAST